MSDIIRIAGAYVEASGNRDGNFKRLFRPAKRILQLSAGNIDDAIERIRDTAVWAKNQRIHWSLYTVLKRWGKENTITPEKTIRKDEGLKSMRDLLREKNLPR